MRREPENVRADMAVDPGELERAAADDASSGGECFTVVEAERRRELVGKLEGVYQQLAALEEQQAP